MTPSRRNASSQKPTTNKQSTLQPSNPPHSEHGHRHTSSSTSLIIDQPTNQTSSQSNNPVNRRTASAVKFADPHDSINQSLGMMDLEDPSLAYSNRPNNQSNNQSDEPPMITLADLESGFAPANFVPKLHQSMNQSTSQADNIAQSNKQSINQSKAAVRHIKDEIDELFYALTVKDKEIRMSRSSVDREVAAAKRATAKLSRDVEDLTRSQAKQIIKQAQQAQLPIPPLSNPIVPMAK